MSFIFAALLAAVMSASTPMYVAGLGDSVMRGDVLPTCQNRHQACPENFFDDTTRALGAIGLQYDWGLDGRSAGGPHGGGVIGEELPRYCRAHVPFAYTIINTGGNDVNLFLSHNIWGSRSLQQAGQYYALMVSDIRQCHPETNVIMISLRDSDSYCTHGHPNIAHQKAYIQFDAYIRQIASLTPNAQYMDVWGPHTNSDGTGNPIYVEGQPWYYGADMYGYVNGVDTGGSCVHPGILGHAHYAATLISIMSRPSSGHN